ncbi:MAG: insulinase family protein [Lachnospiraceae bacterium]|nr:insulinase family protein [Lachnospiraceae bacterium]
MKLEELTSYTILKKQELPDINSVGILLKHNKTGARAAVILNDDENKVFSIGFKTPSKNSTGVAHITEHSVLCGSKKFPVKDPFITLAKGSLNTFLNAMTFPDKTLYPVASCNDADFRNLSDVYLDAVFNPKIYENEAIFRQEGWHYDIDKETGEMTVNGVVYNEMKGTFSSPDSVLEREISSTLFPDTAYGYESGGDPDVIPELTYEAFLDFHRKFYHPSNSYIWLYGNMDAAERLDYIDKEYLSKYEAIETDSDIELQTPFDEMHVHTKEYAISEEEDEDENTFLSLNFTAGRETDSIIYEAFDILDFVLCTVPGAPVKQALIDKGIGKDVYSIYENAMKESYFSIVAKGASVSQKEEFIKTVREVLEKIVSEGFDRKSLLAAINYYEFKYREADYGTMPKGLIYNMIALDSWLYDDDKPFVYLNSNEVYKFFRENIDKGYFENLIKKYLLDNNHKSFLILHPDKKLAALKDEELKEKLKKIKASMTQEETEKVFAMMDALKEYSDREDTPEELATIPMLEISDLDKKAKPLGYTETKIDDIKVIQQDIFTNGIGYITLGFKINDIPEEYVKYLGLLKCCLGCMDTANYNYKDFTNEYLLVTGGGFSCDVVTYSDVNDQDKYDVYFELKGKALFKDFDRALELLGEEILTTKFNDYKRLNEIIAENNSQRQSAMVAGGHSVACQRALSYLLESSKYMEIATGYDNYRFMVSLYKNFEEQKEETSEKLYELSKMIFRKERLILGYTGNTESLKMLSKPMDILTDNLFTCDIKRAGFTPKVEKLTEGLMTSGQVQYVAKAGNFCDKGYEYTGAFRVLKVMMGYEYLWMNVRVKGGAYGCMNAFTRNGSIFFVSYRDPHLKNTIKVFDNAYEAIENFEADERVMTQYIIGAVGTLDVPLTPALNGSRGYGAYMTGLTDSMVQKERDEVIGCTVSDIRKLSKPVKEALEDNALCVVGSALKLKDNKELFSSLTNLI